MECEASLRIENRASISHLIDSAHPKTRIPSYFRMPSAAITAWYFPSSRRRK